MAAPKMTTNFNNYWDFLKMVARKKDLNPSIWFERAGISRQRYYEFEKGENISARSFIKLSGGVRLDPMAVERLAGIDFTADQMSDLNFEKLVDADRETLRRLLNDPDRMAQLREEYK